MGLLTLSALVESTHAETIGQCPTISSKIIEGTLTFEFSPLLGLQMAKIEKQGSDEWLVKCIYPNKVELHTRLKSYTSCHFNNDTSMMKCPGPESACKITCDPIHHK